MKFVLLLITMLLLCSFAPDAAIPFKLTFSSILAILAGCYEVISRLIPTRKVWSIIGKILEVLTWLNKLFDRKK